MSCKNGFEKGTQYLLKKLLRSKNQIKKLQAEIEIEKLKIQNCRCENFQQHVFKADEFVCIKVQNTKRYTK